MKHIKHGCAVSNIEVMNSPNQIDDWLHYFDSPLTAFDFFMSDVPSTT